MIGLSAMQVTFVVCACSLSIVVAALVFFRTKPVYLLNFSCYKPPAWCATQLITVHL